MERTRIFKFNPHGSARERMCVIVSCGTSGGAHLRTSNMFHSRRIIDNLPYKFDIRFTSIKRVMSKIHTQTIAI